MQKLLRFAIVLLFALTAIPLSQAGALDPGSNDARAIFRAALEPKGGARTLSRMKMNIKQGASTRERVLSVRSKRGADERKTLILIEQPADVRNTGFLTIDHVRREQADEQWLYLPALHRVSRVPSSGKADAFVGSDFSISDLSGQDPEDFDVKLVEQTVKLGDEECWLIESVPRSERVKNETGYAKVHSWVSKSKLLPIQLKAWSVQEGRVKYFKASDVRMVGGAWTAHRLQMRTLQGSNVVSETVIEVLAVDNDAQQVTDADFTQQRLERGA